MKEIISRYWRGDAPFWNRFWLLGVMGSLLYLAIAYCIIKYGISPPPNLALNIQGPDFYHANFTIFDAKTVSLPYFIAGLIFLFYLFFASVSILRRKKTPNQTIVHYIAKLIIAYAFIQSGIIVTEIGRLFFGMTPTNSFLEYVFGDSLFSQTIFEQSRPFTIAQYNASQNLITLFTQQALLNLFTYNYTNYIQALTDASHYFSKDGWKRYIRYWKKYSFDDLTAVIDRHLIARVSGMDNPQIMREGDYLGKHYWVVYTHAQVAFMIPSQLTQNVTDRHLYVLVSQEYQTNNVEIEGIIDLP